MHLLQDQTDEFTTAGNGEIVNFGLAHSLGLSCGEWPSNEAKSEIHSCISEIITAGQLSSDTK
jgi:hypothetical protein